MVLKADRMVDVDARAIVEPGVVVVEGEHIRDVSPERVPDDAEVVELGDVTLLPGLMDMELNFLMGGSGSTLMSSVQDDPSMKLMRAIPAAPRRCSWGSPRCATSACSSRPVGCCSTSR